MDRHN
ncbi:SEC14 cytosolic factor family protein / phosphoglyceride transfer family protein [Zea mays]